MKLAVPLENYLRVNIYLYVILYATRKSICFLKQINFLNLDFEENKMQSFSDNINSLKRHICGMALCL